MSEAKSSSDVIEQAMQDALTSVERIEQERRDKKSPDPYEFESVEVHVEDVDVLGDSSEQEAADAAVAPLDETTEQEQPDDDDKDAELEEASAREAALKDQLLRLAADFDNFRKRTERDRKEAKRYAVLSLMQDLLPVLDNLERALAHAGDKEDPVLMGVSMVAKQLLDVLSANGATAFTSLHEKFDPEHHEAVGQVPTDEYAAGTIIEELQKGYWLNDRLLRPARVVVAAAPPSPSPGSENDESGKQSEAIESDVIEDEEQNSEA